MWRRATIEALSSIFSCFFGSVKTSIFHFLSCWVVNIIGTVTDCVSCNLRLAAAHLLQKQLNFLPYWTQINLIWERQHLLVLKDAPGLWSSTFPLSDLSPSWNLTRFYKHWLLQEHWGRHLSDTINSKGMFSLWCDWRNKTWFMLTNPSGPALLSEFKWWCSIERYPYWLNCVGKTTLDEEIHVSKYLFILW